MTIDLLATNIKVQPSVLQLYVPVTWQVQKKGKKHMLEFTWPKDRKLH